MTYRSLLVHLDQDPLCATRTRAAIRLAKDLDCHLVGVVATGLIDLPTSPGAAASLAEFAALAWDTLRDEAEKATQAFRDAAGPLG
jgi:nucleotide-binding universal stress UspA family protein